MAAVHGDLDLALAKAPSSAVPEAAWSGVRGVTGDGSREDELGAGKWSDDESAGARNLEELRAGMSAAPVRDMDLKDSGPPWLLIAGAVSAVGLVVLAVLAFSGPSEGEAPAPADADASGERAPVEALPTVATVTVDTRPTGAEVFLDDRTYGPAPTPVPVPTDDVPHQLCVELAGSRHCRTLTGAALAMEDPYRFDLDD